MISLQVKGLDALHAQLRELGAELGLKTLAAAARKAFKPVLDDAKAMVPVDSGELRDSLKLSVVKPKGGDLTVVVGIRIGKGTGAKQARLAAAAFGEGQSRGLPPAARWHFIELGTAELAPHPFLRPALDHNAGAVLEALKTEIAKGIAKALRARAKGAR